jgi:hypothetical protein
MRRARVSSATSLPHVSIAVAGAVTPTERVMPEPDHFSSGVATFLNREISRIKVRLCAFSPVWLRIR